MFEQTIETSATPHITVDECLGNLVVRGTEDRQVVLRLRDGEEEDLTLKRDGESFTLSARVDCFISCPLGATLTVHTVAENLKVKRIEGALAIDTIHGNVTARAVGPMTLKRVFGNLGLRYATGNLQAQEVKGNARIRAVEGALSLDQVDGNARVQDVEGSLSLNKVGGNARVQGVEGSLSLEQVGGNLVSEGIQGNLTAGQVQGNARLGPPFFPNTAHNLNVSGNLKVRLSADAGLSVALRASGGVRSQVSGLTLEETDGEMRGAVGDGEANLEAQVAGRVTLDTAESEGSFLRDPGFATDLEELGVAIESRVAEAMGELEVRLEEGLSHIDGERVRLQVERATENTLRKAEKAAEKVRRKAEREAERARIRAERAERRWRRVSGKKPESRRGAVSNEERLQVLRMVEEGKVSPDQAADLLAALDGR